MIRPKACASDGWSSGNYEWLIDLERGKIVYGQPSGTKPQLKHLRTIPNKWYLMLQLTPDSRLAAIEYRFLDHAGYDHSQEVELFGEEPLGCPTYREASMYGETAPCAYVQVFTGDRSDPYWNKRVISVRAAMRDGTFRTLKV